MGSNIMEKDYGDERDERILTDHYHDLNFTPAPEEYE